MQDLDARVTGCPRAMAGGGRHPLDRAVRSRVRVPAPAPRADPADPARRGRLAPGRQDVGPRRPTACTATHFVDRPPQPDRAGRPRRTRLGGPATLRLLGALAGRRDRPAGRPDRQPWSPTRTAGRWSAVVDAPALTTSPLIDPVAAKGELLALPCRGAGAVVGTARRTLHVGRAGSRLRLRGRLAGAAALGLKQSLAGGLVFAVVLFLASWVWGPTGGRRARSPAHEPARGGPRWSRRRWRP